MATYTSRYLRQPPKEPRRRHAAQLRLEPIEPFATTDLDARTSPVRIRRLRPPDLSWMRRVLWPAFNHFISDEGFVLAGYIAFTAIFAIFPFMIFILALAGFWGWGDAAADLIELGLDVLPDEVAGVIRPVANELRGGPHGTILTFSVALTLWFSSSGLESLRHALNLAFNVTDTPAFWSNRLRSMVLVMVSATLFLGAMAALVAVPIARDIFAWLAAQDLFEHNLQRGARYLVAVVLLTIVTFSLYLILPNKIMRFEDVWPGAVISISLWIGTTALYSVYLRSFGRYSILYGSLGGVIFTLFYLYLSAVIFIFGAQLNAAIMHERAASAARHAPRSNPTPEV